jgi:hypothetical protein
MHEKTWKDDCFVPISMPLAIRKNNSIKKENGTKKLALNFNVKSVQ